MFRLSSTHASAMAHSRAPRGEYAKSAERRQEIVAAALRCSPRPASTRARSATWRSRGPEPGRGAPPLPVQAPAAPGGPRLARPGRPGPDGRDPRRDSTCSGPWSTWPSTTRRRRSSSSCTSPCRPRPRRRSTRSTTTSSGATPGHGHGRRGVRAGGRRGELQPGVDCASAARTLVALMDGLQAQWLLDPSPSTWPRRCAGTCARWSPRPSRACLGPRGHGLTSRPRDRRTARAHSARAGAGSTGPGDTSW